MKATCNLFPVRGKRLRVKRYKVLWKEGFSEREHTNSLLYEVGESMGSPPLYAGGYIYLFRDPPKEDFRKARLEPAGSEELPLNEVFLSQILNFLERRLGTTEVGKVKDFYFLREPVLRAYEVDGTPHLCVDYKIRLVRSKSLQEEIEEGATEEEIRESALKLAVGRASSLFVADRVFQVDERDIDRYEELSSSTAGKRAWREARELIRRGRRVFAVEGYFRKSVGRYTYPAHALKRVVFIEELDEGGRDYVIPDPTKRMKEILDIKKETESLLKGIGIMVRDHSPSPTYLKHYPKIYDAEGRVYEVRYHNVKDFIEKLGGTFSPFLKGDEIKVLLLFVGIGEEEARKEYKKIFQNIVSRLEGFGLSVDTPKPMYTRRNETRESVRESLEGEGFIEKMKEISPDIVIVFLREFGDLDLLPGGRTLYDIIKQKLNSLRIPSQIIREKTLESFNEFKMVNVLLGILGKTGNFPYKVRLREKTLYVGIDVARRELRGKRGAYSMAGVCKIFSDGFHEYVIKKFFLEGEALGEDFIDSVAHEIKRVSQKGGFEKVVIHRDGPIYPKERRAFEDIFSRQGIKEFELVSVVKRGSGRLFERSGDAYRNPRRNLFLQLSERSFILSTYDVRRGSHQPLKVSLELGDSSPESIARDILSLTLLNYASFTLGKLPATVSHADKIAKCALDGLIEEGRGDKMFWL